MAVASKMLAFVRFPRGVLWKGKLKRPVWESRVGESEFASVCMRDKRVDGSWSRERASWRKMAKREGEVMA